MTTPERALLEAIERTPGADAPQQVYADWLEQRGDERARFLRAQLDFAARAEAGTQGELWPQLALQHLALPSDWLSRVALRFDLILDDYEPSSKIQTIKQIRTLTGLGLRDAKNLSESTPSVVLAGLDCATAEATRLLLCHREHTPEQQIGHAHLVPSTSPPCDRGGTWSNTLWTVGPPESSDADPLTRHLILWQHPPEVLRPHLEALPEAARGGLPLLDAIVLQQLLLHRCERTLPLVRLPWPQEPDDDE